MKLYVTKHLIIGSLLCAPMYGMDAQQKAVTVVDINNQNHPPITQNLSCDHGEMVGVFGATPDYSLFKKYICTLLEHCAFALQAKTKKQPCKIRINELLGKESSAMLTKFICQDPGNEPHALNRINTIIAAFQNNTETTLPCFDTLVDAFLAFNINQNEIRKNLQDLVNVAESQNITRFVHVLLPSYFKACDLPIEGLYRFLRLSADYYRRLYESLDIPAHVNIVVVVPRLEHFAEFMTTQGTTQDAIHCIAHLMYHDFIANNIPKDHGCYAFINTNADENTMLCNLFAGLFGIHIANITYAIYHDNRGNQLTTFTPYVLKKSYTNASLNDFEHAIPTLQLLKCNVLKYLINNIFATSKDQI